MTVNGFWLMLPILAINVALSGALPAAYQDEMFWSDIPLLLGLAENASRVAITALPLLMMVRWSDYRARPGLALYICGLAAYGAAWIALILAPDSVWSASLPGFSAPAWLPLFWLGGLHLSTHAYFSWVRPAFLMSSGIFLVSHIAHTALVFGRMS